MAYSKEQLVQRELNFVIVDEVDSILIDESRVPLIISGAAQDNTELYNKVNIVAGQLTKDADFALDEKSKNVTLTDSGSLKVEGLLKQSGLLLADQSLYDIGSVNLVHHVDAAVKAHAAYVKDRDYIVKDGEVILIDEFTGRMGIGRRLSMGLHQALEAKEGVKVQAESQTLASITYQNFFKLYNKLSGMTGTAMTEVDEFEQIYNLQVVEVPTFRKIARIDENDAIYRTKRAKIKFILEDIKIAHAKQQPVLVGTGSIESSEELSKMLKKANLEHNVLNAKFHQQEADIISQAGKPGAITIATHMAGRGTDIKLGGNLELMLKDIDDEHKIAKIKNQYEIDKDIAIRAGGLRVISTQRNESRRIDNQLRGRSGRQGDVGSSKFYISVEDDLMRIFAANLENLMQRFNLPEEEALENRIVTRSLETAQRRIEGMNFDSRKEVLNYDNVISDQRKVIYAQRKEILEAESINEIVLGFIEDLIEQIVYTNLSGKKEDWDIETFKEECKRLLNIMINDEDIQKFNNSEDAIEKLLQFAIGAYDQKKLKYSEKVMNSIEQELFLHVLDDLWRDHLRGLDFLRANIHLRANAQKNPLNEYKAEAFKMFASIISSLKEVTIGHLMRLELSPAGTQQTPRAQVSKPKHDFPVPESRNATCPCGSGKRYKHCCGRL